MSGQTRSVLVPDTVHMFYARQLVLIGLLLTSACASSARLSSPVLVTGEPPYWREVVRIDTGLVTLAGTLLVPVTEGPVPAVIIIPGSGPATRNGSSNMYQQIGEHLVQRGIAVLLYDKRGVGGSSGNWEVETFEERAQDVAAMVGYLKDRSEIDPARIGLIGHSQGGYIAPLVVADGSPDVAFVVLLAGPGQTVWDQVLTNARAEALGNGATEAEVDEQIRDLEGQLKLARRFAGPCRALRVSYLCFVLDYDPQTALEKLTVPTLALYAQLDTQVPPAINIPLVEAALQRAANANYAIYTFEAANHWFAAAETGTTAEMRELVPSGMSEHYEFVPGFLDTLAEWIAAQSTAEGRVSVSSRQREPSPIPEVSLMASPGGRTASRPK